MLCSGATECFHDRQRVWAETTNPRQMDPKNYLDRADETEVERQKEKKNCSPTELLLRRTGGAESINRREAGQGQKTALPNQIARQST